MWPYKNHSKTEYYRVVEFVQNYAESLGAEYVCTKSEKFTTVLKGKAIEENLELKVYKYKDEFFRVEYLYMPERPFIVFSFGDSIESIFDDADPFPYDLSEYELKAEVRYSLGIETPDDIIND